MRVAIIPARGGSKRIPRKNIRTFCGKPMIGWSIDAAIASGCFDRIIVSTDDPEIASAARDFGAEAPFVRPAELSGDLTGTIPVVAHAVRWLDEHDAACEAVCCIYATAPFLRASDLRHGLVLLEAEQIDYAFSAARFEFPIQRAIRINAKGRVSMLDPTKFGVRSQDLEATFHDAGQFYWGRSVAWRTERTVFAPDSRAVILPRFLVQDIDTEEDWERAEWMWKALQQGGGLA